MTLVEANEKEKKDPEVVSLQGFSGEMRDQEVLTFKEGDEFTIPEVFEVLGIKLPGSDIPVQFILVSVNGVDGKNVIKRFFPSTFWKNRMEYTADKVPTDHRYLVSGTAVDFVHKYGTVAEAMDALKGKKLRISKMITITTLSIRGNLARTSIPTIDLV